MNIQIEKLLLHRRGGVEGLAYKFETGKINLISGENSKGKTSFVTAVDYALASKDNVIDKSVRRAIDFVGAILKIGESRHLFARHVSYESDKSKLCYYEELNASDDGFVVENFTREKGVSADRALRNLNRLIGADIITSESQQGKTHSLSLRVLLDVVLQDYHTISAEKTLFRNQDNIHVAQSLVSWLPYVVGVHTVERMRAQIERDDAEAKYKRLRNELTRAYRLSEQWQADLDGELNNCRKLGLIRDGETIGKELSDKVILLHAIRERSLETYTADPNTKACDEATDDLMKKQKLQAEYALELHAIQDRIDTLRSCESDVKDVVADAKRLESRLKLAEWLGEVWCRPSDMDLFSTTIGKTGQELHQEMEKLSAALLSYQSTLTNAQKQAAFGAAVERELKALYERRRELEAKHILLSAQIRQQVREQRTAKVYVDSQRAAFMQLGRIEKMITLAESMVDRNPATDRELAELKSIAESANARVENELRLEEIRKSQFRVDMGESLTTRVRELDAQSDILSAQAYFELSKLDVLLQFPDHTDLLSERGSSHNHIAYHIAITAAIQEYLAGKELSPMPSFVFYDQPTQSNNKRPGLVLDKLLESLERSVSAAKVADNDGWQPIVIDMIDKERRENLNEEKYHLVAELEGEEGFVPAEWMNER